jgi:hypothetical protein
MPEIVKKTRELSGVDPSAIPYRDLLDAQEPVILKGILKDWPLVQKGYEGAESAMAYLKSFYSGKPALKFTGAPEIGGRFFYTEDLSDRNFEASHGRLDEFLDTMAADFGNPAAPTHYIGSTDVDQFLPGLRGENDLVLHDPMFGKSHTFVTAWIGGVTTTAAHYDMSNNMACCLVGNRRFTLFPPGQVANLYPGPLERTPGGQVVSMVDFRDPDFDRYPCFEDALKAGEVAELEPGDLLLYPALWWHMVEALDPFNVMINYWWNDVPEFIDDPRGTMMQAMLSLRDRPQAEKDAWLEIFKYYVFGDAELPAKHLPEEARGALGPLDDMKARRLRAELLQRLNR